MNSIEEFKMTLDNSYEGSYLDVSSKKEIEESRRSFIESLKKAVKAGGEVIVDRNGFLIFKQHADVALCISESDAIEFCGYKK